MLCLILMKIGRSEKPNEAKKAVKKLKNVLRFASAVGQSLKQTVVTWTIFGCTSQSKSSYSFEVTINDEQWSERTKHWSNLTSRSAQSHSVSVHKEQIMQLRNPSQTPCSPLPPHPTCTVGPCSQSAYTKNARIKALSCNTTKHVQRTLTSHSLYTTSTPSPHPHSERCPSPQIPESNYPIILVPTPPARLQIRQLTFETFIFLFECLIYLRQSFLQPPSPLHQ